VEGGCGVVAKGGISCLSDDETGREWLMETREANLGAG
jgi:hypothetical protein